MIEYGYRKNEWVAIYSDECGDTQVLPFDTYGQAENFVSNCCYKIGVMTTALYNRFLADNL